jgi:hypothetical protein
MDLSLFQILLVMFVAYTAQLIDSSIGMLYGTLVSAFLVALKFPPLIVIPAILISQTIGCLITAKQHHKLKNLNFEFHFPESRNALFQKIKEDGVLKVVIDAASEDLKIGMLSIIFGGFFTFLGALLAVNISSLAIKTWVGSVDIVLGTLLIMNITFNFSFIQTVVLSLIGAFADALGGGGFGVIMTSSQIVGGKKLKKSVAMTALTSTFLGVIAFLTYWLLNGIADWEIIFFLCYGAFWGAKAGSIIKKDSKIKKIKKYLGGLIIFLGFIILLQAWL